MCRLVGRFQTSDESSAAFVSVNGRVSNCFQKLLIISQITEYCNPEDYSLYLHIKSYKAIIQIKRIESKLNENF